MTDYSEYLPGILTIRQIELYVKNPIEYIATLTELENDATEVEYVMEVNWDLYVKRYGDNYAIPNIDPDRVGDVFHWNYVPSIIRSTIPPKNRYDLKSMLDRMNLKWYDAFLLYALMQGHGNFGLYFKVIGDWDKNHDGFIVPLDEGGLFYNKCFKNYRLED